MGLLTSPLCCAAKCCGCIVLSQLLALLFSVGAIVLFLLVFYFYVLPWGKREIVAQLGLPKGTSFDSIDPSVIAAQRCAGCVFGTNTQWPTNTTGTQHFLDTSAGTTISSVVATSLAATAAVGAGSMLWASIVPSMASVLSFTGGFYEMTHILEAAQYIGMIGQLQLRGAPEFLRQFSKELAWTNFNIPKSVSKNLLPGAGNTRRLLLADSSDDPLRRLDENGSSRFSALEPKFDGDSGPAKYAKTLGVQPKNLFFYTLLIFGGVVVLIHILYIVWVVIMICVSKKKKSFGEVAGTWYRKVVWAVLLALLLAQYIFAMAGSYYVSENTRSSEAKDSNFVYGCLALAAVIGFALLFGIAIIANNTKELKDIGSYEHEQRPFAAKYSAYYDEYNFDNRFFFVPRILLAVSTGAVVGVIREPMTQLLLLLGITALYLILLLLREPNLLRFLYYIGLASVFLKVVLLSLMLILVKDDLFPQSVRDNVSYVIIGINLFIFFLLFLRQAYLIIYKRWRSEAPLLLPVQCNDDHHPELVEVTQVVEEIVEVIEDEVENDGHEVDIDAMNDDDDDEDDDRKSIDIDDDDDDTSVDMDNLSIRDNDSMLDAMSSANREGASPSHIQRVDDIGVHTPRSSGRNDRSSFLSAISAGVERQSSQVSVQSDDDMSFYIDGRMASNEAQRQRREQAGPIKL
ncbi:hypothetical protein ATCC90586_005189 [Pythium insidiosum]|nr:hypothetical protein ATCC90586_005189 [Pythium insidiosum]